MDSNYSFKVGKYYKYRDQSIFLCSGVEECYIKFSHELIKKNFLNKLPYEYIISTNNYFFSSLNFWEEYVIEKIFYDNKRLNQIIYAI